MRRRSFLHKTSLVSASTFVPSFLRLNWDHLSKSREGNILVVVQLSGGNDGLNTVIPYKDDIYYRLRPSLGLSKSSIIDLDGHVGLHSALRSLLDLYDNEQMSVLNAVGYPNPNRSHFRSMDIWQTGKVDSYGTTGWLGRYLDGNCGGCSVPYHAIEIGDNLSLALQGRNRDGFAMRDPQKLQKATENKFLRKLATQVDVQPGDGDLGYLYKTMIEVQESAAYLTAKSEAKESKERYPLHAFGKGLKQIAELILADTATKIYYISLPGFDTHVNQVARQERLLKVYADGIKSFVRDLKQNNLFKEVAILTFSEFGRRVAENGSRGTDHGAANTVFLMGGSLKKAGLYNATPNLKDLQDGDLRHQIDFRHIYANILDGWLDGDAREILNLDKNEVRVL